MNENERMVMSSQGVPLTSHITVMYDHLRTWLHLNHPHIIDEYTKHSKLLLTELTPNIVDEMSKILYSRLTKISRIRTVRHFSPETGLKVAKDWVNSHYEEYQS